MMREFLLNEQLMDRATADFINEDGEEYGLFPVCWVHYNERVKVACFTDGCTPLSEKLPGLNLDQTCSVAKRILIHASDLRDAAVVSLENVLWDPDSIYIDEVQKDVRLICVPALVPPESENSVIYARRLYTLIEDIISVKDESGFICRQIDYQKSKNFGDWRGLMDTLDLRDMRNETESQIILRGINTPEPCVFTVRQDTFRIGSDPGEAEGTINDTEKIDPVHATIGWNGINYFVVDAGSENGTYVNDQRITPHMEIPIGEGTVLRFGDYTFNVE